MSFSELIRLMKEFKEEMKEAKQVYQNEIKPLLKELIEEVRKLREAIERCRTT